MYVVKVQFGYESAKFKFEYISETNNFIQVISEQKVKDDTPVSVSIEYVNEEE